MLKGKIAEVFESIQGEGLYLGEKQLFVRFFGCNLNYCKFCDTKLNYFREYAPEELFGELKRYEDAYHSVAFTGGEPLLQKDFLKEVLKLTRKAGFKNYLDTNGTLPEELKEVIDFLDIVAMDLKLPSSTSLGEFWSAHEEFLAIASQKEVFLKTVICQSTKEEDLREALKLINKINPALILVLQPNSYEDAVQLRPKLENFRDISTENNIIACVIAQAHKIIGVR
jgi:organic radical activating enzyme